MKSIFPVVHGQLWSLSPSSMDSWSPRLMQCFNYLQRLVQNYFHTNRHSFINSPVIPSFSNPSFCGRKLWWWILIRGTENGFYQQTQFLNGVSESSVLSWNELCLRSLSFLPIIEFMPTLCLYAKYLPEIPLLTFLSFRVSAQHLCLCPWYLTSPF